MLLSSRLRWIAALLVIGVFAVLPFACIVQPAWNDPASQDKAVDPWAPAQVLQPPELVRELGASKPQNAPAIVYVGFRTLFEGGHIPGASFHGTASTEKGLAELKKSLAAIPHSTNVVIYCGCCPFDRCPNIRPAYTALHEMGFTHLRVLALPKSFAADWVEKGYPIKKGL
ncbi:MAG: rhodanese-like domain-containing protein [Candidatus Acidiferrum sp.]